MKLIKEILFFEAIYFFCLFLPLWLSNPKCAHWNFRILKTKHHNKKQFYFFLLGYKLVLFRKSSVLQVLGKNLSNF